jgi:hypothetical protein
MSRPQYVVRGQVILADRVSLEHRFLLRPDRQMRELFFYLLQFYAGVHGIRIHAVVLMSTHYHLLFTDVRGVRGDCVGSALARGPTVSRNRAASRTDVRFATHDSASNLSGLSRHARKGGAGLSGNQECFV